MRKAATTIKANTMTSNNLKVEIIITKTSITKILVILKVSKESLKDQDSIKVLTHTIITDMRVNRVVLLMIKEGVDTITTRRTRANSQISHTRGEEIRMSSRLLLLDLMRLNLSLISSL